MQLSPDSASLVIGTARVNGIQSRGARIHRAIRSPKLYHCCENFTAAARRIERAWSWDCTLR
jgi:hypothetical protein